MLCALRQDAVLGSLLLSALHSHRDLQKTLQMVLLVPQHVTLHDVDVSAELVQTHLVLMERGVHGQPRGIVSINGLRGTLQPDDSINIHCKLPSNSLAETMRQGNLLPVASHDLPQLQSQILVLRRAQLEPSAELPLSAPLPLLVISDPLFVPGCGWKVSEALQLCTHRFATCTLASLRVADLPQLLHEYQILARAWQDKHLPDYFPPSARQQ